LNAWAVFRTLLLADRLRNAVDFDEGIQVSSGPETTELSKRADKLTMQYRAAMNDFRTRYGA